MPDQDMLRDEEPVFGGFPGEENDTEPADFKGMDAPDTEDDEETPAVDDLYRYDFARLRMLSGPEQDRRFYEIRRWRFAAIRIGLFLAGILLLGIFLYVSLRYFLLSITPGDSVIFFLFAAVIYLTLALPLYRIGRDGYQRARQAYLPTVPQEELEEITRTEQTQKKIRIAAMAIVGSVVLALSVYKPVDTWRVLRQRIAQANPPVEEICLTDREESPFAVIKWDGGVFRWK